MTPTKTQILEHDKTGAVIAHIKSLLVLCLANKSNLYMREILTAPTGPLFQNDGWKLVLSAAGLRLVYN